MALKTINLELARNSGSPDGDTKHGYVFRAPLTPDGAFDRYRWAAERQLCTVKKIVDGDAVESGVLVLNRRGEWVFSYEKGDEDDETLFRLASHRFVPGEYMSITEHDGVQRTFRIASVSDWHPARHG